MPTIEELKKEAEENIEKFSKELQLLNQRQNLVAQEIIRLQGEIRGFTKLLQSEKDEETQKQAESVQHVAEKKEEKE